MPDVKLEGRYLACLRSLVPDLAAGEPRRGESPDYVIACGSRRIGIELTEFHLAPTAGNRPHREVSSLRWRVMERARILHHQHGGPALYLHGVFDGHAPATKREVSPLAESLALAVLASPAPTAIAEGSMDLPWDAIPRGFRQVWFWASVDGVDSLWQPLDSGWVAGVPSAEVANVINSKGRKVEAYRKRCDELWLVIVHNVATGAPAELRSEARNYTYVSSFDRVLWLDPHRPSIWEFVTRAA